MQFWLGESHINGYQLITGSYKLLLGGRKFFNARYWFSVSRSSSSLMAWEDEDRGRARRSEEAKFTARFYDGLLSRVAGDL